MSSAKTTCSILLLLLHMCLWMHSSSSAEAGSSASSSKATTVPDRTVQTATTTTLLYSHVTGGRTSPASVAKTQVTTHTVEKEHLTRTTSHTVPTESGKVDADEARNVSADFTDNASQRTGVTPLPSTVSKTSVYVDANVRANVSLSVSNETVYRIRNLVDDLLSDNSTLSVEQFVQTYQRARNEMSNFDDNIESMSNESVLIYSEVRRDFEWLQSAGCPAYIEEEAKFLTCFENSSDSYTLLWQGNFQQFCRTWGVGLDCLSANPVNCSSRIVAAMKISARRKLGSNQMYRTSNDFYKKSCKSDCLEVINNSTTCVDFINRLTNITLFTAYWTSLCELYDDVCTPGNSKHNCPTLDELVTKTHPGYQTVLNDFKKLCGPYAAVATLATKQVNQTIKYYTDWKATSSNATLAEMKTPSSSDAGTTTPTQLDTTTPTQLDTTAPHQLGTTTPGSSKAATEAPTNPPPTKLSGQDPRYSPNRPYNWIPCGPGDEKALANEPNSADGRLSSLRFTALLITVQAAILKLK